MTLTPLLVVVLFAPLSLDSMRHSLAMSRARESAAPRLWELCSKIPRDAEIVVEEQDLDDELRNTLFSGLFWLPGNEIHIVESARVQTVRGRPIVQLTKRWFPDRLLHGGAYKWYLRGHSARAVCNSRYYYDLGSGDDDFLFNAPPADEGQARWSGESPDVELHLLPGDYRIYLAQKPSPQYGECAGQVTLNGRPLGRLSTEDPIAAFDVDASSLRSDGRQILSLKISPRSNPSATGPWLHGIRLDWIYCEPRSLYLASGANSFVRRRIDRILPE